MKTFQKFPNNLIPYELKSQVLLCLMEIILNKLLIPLTDSLKCKLFLRNWYHHSNHVSLLCAVKGCPWGLLTKPQIMVWRLSPVSFL